jgi:hypothetical protein
MKNLYRLALAFTVAAMALLAPVAHAQGRQGSICAFIYEDLNGDTGFEWGEPFVHGTVAIRPVGGGAAQSVTVYGSGEIPEPEVCTAVLPGNYVVEVQGTTPAGFLLPSPRMVTVRDAERIGLSFPVRRQTGGSRSNVLQNGSFEEAPSTSSIPFWSTVSWRGAGRAAVQVGTAHDRSRSASLENPLDDDTRLLQTVDVKPNKTYRLSGWVRTEGVRIVQSGGQVGANLAVEGGFEHSNSVIGTSGWTLLELTFNSGNRSSVQVGPRLGHHGSTVIGKAWFDDLRLVEVNGSDETGGGESQVILNNAPALNQGWSRIMLQEAVGGDYHATWNRAEGAVSTAIWEGELPHQVRPYRVEVFIPRTGSTPRTNHAVYQIAHEGIVGTSQQVMNQHATSSRWVTLGTFPFQGSYRIELTDETGEARGTRSVVANAIRLTPVP